MNFADPPFVLPFSPCHASTLEQYLEMLTSYPGPTLSFTGDETSVGAPSSLLFPPTDSNRLDHSFHGATNLVYPSTSYSANTSAPSTPPFVGDTTAELPTSFHAPASARPHRSGSRPLTVKSRSHPYHKLTKSPSSPDNSALSLALSSQDVVFGRVAESSIGHTEEARREKLKERNRLSKRAQRQRQVNHVAALEARVEQKEGEVAELRAELRSKEQVIAMLWERLRDCGNV